MPEGDGDQAARLKLLEEEAIRRRDDATHLWREISKLQRFQAWVTGLAIGAAAALGFFADYIKKHLGL